MSKVQSTQTQSHIAKRTEPLSIKVTVDASHMELLNEGATFVAGSSGDCSAISPMPEPRLRGRRRSAAKRQG